MRRSRSVAVLVAIALLVSACSLFGRTDSATTTPPEPDTTAATSGPATAPNPEPTETTTAPTTTQSTTTAQPVVDVELILSSCDQPVDLSILCETYDILQREFVDPLDPAALAAGATRGIEQFLQAEPAPSPTGSLTCPLPTDAFEATCSAAQQAIESEQASLESIAEAAVAGMMEFGLDDPNSVYYTARIIQQLDEERTGTISGIGTLVQTDEEVDGERQVCNTISTTCRMRIVGVLDDAPAEQAGILVGDVVVGVDGTPIDGLTVDQIVSMVRGEEGTAVTLTIERGDEVLEFTLIRAVIVIPVTASEMLDGGIGYIELTEFTSNSGQLFRTELESLLDAGAESFIVDLRNNRGGALNAAIDIASEFLADGLVLRTQSPGGDRDYRAQDGGLLTDPSIAVALLVNEGSASASEVVAGVLQETGRATVIGTATFGKNTVQQQFGLSNGGAIKVTIARWVTPDGLDFGGDGIIPDIAVDAPPDADPRSLIDEAIDFLTG